MTLVIDASMALAWIYAREKPAEAECAPPLQTITEMEASAPALWHTEIANALLVGERRKIITAAQTIDYLTRLARLPIAVDDATPAARQDQINSACTRICPDCVWRHVPGFGFAH